ncbi:hypothetical protein [Flavobacterium sp. FPG59]|jgi:hypothetical protein|uniref:hypothetical protein n=1 Tax=Flavobacterium sp. FPG59 TaxID=1929267 RepID=UPI000A3BC78F|nr:hypothetical protein [Flavobacterium sp. FPG59]OUD35444.1 hypothetical protein FPG59_10250 [Flavobacterium sp. FPG59]
MKKTTLIVLLLSTFSILFAQAPQKMSYQSVIRKTDGTLVVNTVVGLKISILQGSENGTATYVETQTVTTNANGLATLAIGGGTAVTGTFAGINWGTGTYFIKTETDPTGGTNYTISGTSQLLSVPYALYAGNSQNKGKTSIVITGNITNEQAAIQIAAEFGPYTENVYIRNTTGLTTVDLSAITSLINLSISENANLTSINLSGLTAIYEVCYIEDNEALNVLSFPVLKITPSNGEFSIDENPVLTSILFPVLTTISEINISENPIITSISFPMLANVKNQLAIDGNLSLTSIGLPLLSNCGSIYFSGNALPSSQINTLLNKLLTVTPSSRKYVSLSDQKPPAPPTGQGLIDKQTLINAGNTVSTD